jgi:hypothetical protein
MMNMMKGVRLAMLRMATAILTLLLSVFPFFDIVTSLGISLLSGRSCNQNKNGLTPNSMTGQKNITEINAEIQDFPAFYSKRKLN